MTSSRKSLKGKANYRVVEKLACNPFLNFWLGPNCYRIYNIPILYGLKNFVHKFPLGIFSNLSNWFRFHMYERKININFCTLHWLHLTWIIVEKCTLYQQIYRFYVNGNFNKINIISSSEFLNINNSNSNI